MRTKWKMIGLGLRLRSSDLEAMSGSPQDCLESSMSKWLKRVDPSPTWKAIVAVLRSKVVDEEGRAKELEEKFCRDIPSEPPVKGIIIALHGLLYSHPLFAYTAVPQNQSETSDSLVGSQESAMTLSEHLTTSYIYNIVFN